MLNKKIMLNELEPAPQSILSKDYLLKNILIKNDQEEKNLISMNNSTNQENVIQETNLDTSKFLIKKRGRKNRITIDADKYGLIHDKYSDDNIKRKIKTHFHNFIIALLNMKAGEVLDKNNKFGKISFEITQNITVDYNQKLFDQKIMDIIVKVSEKYHNQNKNRFALYLVMKKFNYNSEIIQILNMTYKELYINYYLKSTKKLFEGEQEDESYEKHIIRLGKKFGPIYALEYRRNAESLITFFYMCKKRVRKKKSFPDNKSVSSLTFQNSQETNNISNSINYYENSNNYSVIENMPKLLISTCTQTNSYLIDGDDY